MDLSKSLDVFDPTQITDSIHIIGCGAIGSSIAELLTRLGVEQLHIWDFDEVEPKNIANQMFFNSHIGKKKTECVAQICRAINPSIDIISHGAWDPEKSISGIVFMAVDSIKIRQQIVQACIDCKNVRAIFDFRMRLYDAQHYAADCTQLNSVENLVNSMDFTDEEAKAATPTSACGTSLSLAMTVRMIVAAGISNFVQFILTGKLNKLMLIDTSRMFWDVM